MVIGCQPGCWLYRGFGSDEMAFSADVDGARVTFLVGWDTLWRDGRLGEAPDHQLALEALKENRAQYEARARERLEEFGVGDGSVFHL